MRVETGSTLSSKRFFRVILLVLVSGARVPAQNGTPAQPRTSVGVGQGTSKIEVPIILTECDGGPRGQCAHGGGGIWLLGAKQPSAFWPYGAVATLSIERYDADEIVIQRSDNDDSSSPGFAATYKGKLQGNQLNGYVYMGSAAGAERKAAYIWSATIGCEGNDGQRVNASQALAKGDEGKSQMNAVKAACWWTLAAELESAKAETNLGALYLFGGSRFRTNYKEAEFWLKKAKSEDPQAVFYLALMAHYGWGSQRPDQANGLMKEAAERGDIEARDYMVCSSQQSEDALIRLFHAMDKDADVARTNQLLQILSGTMVTESEYHVTDVALLDANSESQFTCTVSLTAKREVQELKADSTGQHREIVPQEVTSQVPIIQTVVMRRDQNKKCSIEVPYLGYAGSPVRPIALPKRFQSDAFDCPSW